MQRSSANIVIVGAGLAGAATAFHLRRLGVEDVLVLEREASPGEHSSGRNAAIVRSCIEDPDVQTLARQGAEELRTSRLATFRRTGGFLIGAGVEEVVRYFPLAQGLGRWFPTDGVTDPAGLLHAYLAGSRVRLATRVLHWRVQGSDVCVSTTRGEIFARRIVNAAGPWAGALGGLPLTPRNRHLVVTPPLTGIAPDWPYVWDTAHGLYFRPESGGLLLCPCDEQVRAPGDYRIDHAQYERLGELLARHQPRLADVAVRKSWTGQRTFAADGKFVIGFDPREPHLFHVAGLGGHGVTASYAVGQLAALQLASGEPAASNPFDPARLIRFPVPAGD